MPLFINFVSWRLKNSRKMLDIPEYLDLTTRCDLAALSASFAYRNHPSAGEILKHPKIQTWISQ